MIEQILAVIRNTFFESIRQPIMLVVLVSGTIALVLANPLSAFTMDDDQRMYIDMGLASVFIFGALLASFIATNVLTREIENKTALTVISKPVGRPLFVLGKFIGVALALTTATLYLCFVFMLVEQHGVIQTVREPIHVPVIAFGVSAAVIGLGVAAWCNYFYGKVFASTVILVTTPLAALAYFLSLLFHADFSRRADILEAFRPELWLALGPLLIAILMLTAIAIALSTRLGQVLTLCITLGIFLIGLLSDHFFGQRIEGYETVWLARAKEAGLTVTEEVQSQIQLIDPGKGDVPEVPVRIIDVATQPLTTFAEAGETFGYGLCLLGRSAVPNFQVLWLSDALTQGHVIPMPYVIQSSIYGVLYIVVALCVATILFQRREVG